MDTAEFDIVITSHSSSKTYLKECWEFRRLFGFFVWRDTLIRYKQTMLGMAWAVLRPLISIAMFSLVFGSIAKLSSDGVSYPLFVLAGMLPWQFFANCINDNFVCMLTNTPLITKVYFPRVFLPLNQIVVNSVDFLVSFLLLFILLAFSGDLFNPTLIFLPLFMLLVVALCVGVGFWMAAISVRFRDIRFVLPFITQFGMFVSPVGYSAFLASESWRWLYFLNPMVGIIEGFRWSCFGVVHADLPLTILFSVIVCTALVVSGFFYFRKVEHLLADII